jgi:sortase B
MMPYFNLMQMAAQVQAAQQAAKETTEATGATEETEETVPTTEGEPVMMPGYAELHEQNPHMVGWIKIEGTKMDYPVMHSPDKPNFYLEHDFDGNKSARGCIYAREECDLFEPTDNITLYGHNMRDGSMFASLNAYVNKETWDYNSLIFFDNLYEAHVYQIFAVFTTTASVGEGFPYHQMDDAYDEEEFADFIRNCKDLQLYETGITPVYGDKIICLSTCEYSQENGRLVVAAVRMS